MVQLYTSGTTGLPKGVRLTNRNYLATFNLVAASRGLDYDVGRHRAGGDAVLPCRRRQCRADRDGERRALGDRPGCRPDHILDLIARERVNHAFLAPAIIMMLMHAPAMASADLSSMKVLSYGASPISEDLLAKARTRFRCQFIQFTA